MKKLIYILLGLELILMLLLPLCFAEEIDWDRLVEAIYKAENSEKYPYGIKSIDTKGNKEYARQICMNTVKNNYKRWIVAGKPKPYREFLGDRYCPPTVHKLNKHWVKNVRYFYKETK